MDSNKATLQKKLQYFETSCREAGLKVTHQRLEIYRELASASDHPTAETLYKRLQENMPTLSLDTVYRTLGTFVEHGVISRVQTTESHARFEAEVEQHHHAFCRKCGEITDFQWDVLDKVQLPSQVSEWGQISNQQITLHGTCSQCALKQKTEG